MRSVILFNKRICMYVCAEINVVKTEIADSASPHAQRGSLAWRQVQAESADVPMPCSTTKLLGTWWTTARQSLTSFTDSVCVQLQQSSSLRTTPPSQHMRPSNVFCCWPDCLELTAWRPLGSELFCRHLQTVAEDILVLALLRCAQRIRRFLRQCAI